MEEFENPPFIDDSPSEKKTLPFMIKLTTLPEGFFWHGLDAENV
jgi:hypothetical protein